MQRTEDNVEAIKDWSSFIPLRSTHQERGEPSGEVTFDLEEESESEVMAEDQYDTATVNDFAIKSKGGHQSCIKFPPMTAHDFEIKPVMISMLQAHGMYHGHYNEDVDKHISRFLEVCDCFKINGVPDDVLKLRLFPFTISDKAREWFDNLEAGSIKSWEELENKLKARFFSDDKLVEARNTFLSFEQQPEENLYTAWERYKMLIR